MEGTAVRRTALVVLVVLAAACTASNEGPATSIAATGMAATTTANAASATTTIAEATATSTLPLPSSGPEGCLVGSGSEATGIDLSGELLVAAQFRCANLTKANLEGDAAH